jgi:LacI family transcriptional regulator
MTVTLAQIAKQAGVAKSVASTVLNKSKSTVRISDETRQRVLALARDLNYQPSFSARALRKCKTFMLGFICGDIHTPNFSELASIALVEAEKRGYRLLISVTEWNYQKEIECLKMLLQRQVDGVMMWSAAIRPGGQRHELITREKLPVVVFDQEVNGVTSITSNWKPGMDQAVEHLKAKGHLRIGYIRQSNIDKSWDSKCLAFLETCSRHGVQTTEYACLANLEDAQRIGREIARDPSQPTAIIALSDYIATGVIRSLYEEGVEVPRDMAVVGMDGTMMGQCFRPALTSITMDRRRMAVEAIHLLLEIIEGKDVPSRVISIPTDLIIRESS